ncbi:UDP-glucose--hexose-1-phosphate uridylyltransferase [Roseivirga pacifica]|uniref:UDP-glucose--hexose-1-phosphate uridylyltransferase n=1 Tax=Roseivirga pacifica TaxID=1267423 RepID=UPI00227C52EF|nr:UDP-glucose--hexose-1-phosphate uridylyltransferase [Roseivirga pacifica]
MVDLQNNPHRRFNPLTNEWVLVSPHRAKRPWQGKTESLPADNRPSYDPNCYLCPGNTRAGGLENEKYTSTSVFTNDFGALLPEGEEEKSSNGLLVSETVKGICRVVCFSPDHSLTLPLMSESHIEEVIRLWQTQYAELGAKDFINYVQIFENKGEIMGCSNPHPHGQIWATSNIPDEPFKENKAQKAYYAEHGRTLLGDYLKQELAAGERIVLENEHFVALVPYWAVWPYETMLISKRAVQHIGQLSDEEVASYADIMKRLTVKYDNLFETSFPYSSGIHQAPTDGESHPEWHLHMHFYPPLLRSATVKKFMVGFEMMANPQRDITAEYSAKVLRELPEVHYSL